jgi:chorismate mutase
MAESPLKLATPARLDALEDLRKSVDNLDSAVIAILAERFRLTEKIGQTKAAVGFAPADMERERRQLEHYRRLADSYGLDVDVVVDVMTTIIEHVKARHRVLIRAGAENR